MFRPKFSRNESSASQKKKDMPLHSRFLPCQQKNGPCEPCEKMLEIEMTQHDSMNPVYLNQIADLRLQMNRLHDKTNVFPSEIKSIIFEYCCDWNSTYAIIRSHGVLTSVCSEWRRIATSTPALWNTIPASVHDSGVELIDAWLARAGSLPLSIIYQPPGLYGPRQGYRLEMKVIEVLNDYKYTSRIQRLDISNDCQAQYMMSKIEPNLTHLTHLTTTGWYAHNAIDLLKKCPQATHVKFLWLRFQAWQEGSINAAVVLTHSHLTSLTTTFDDLSGYGPKALFQHLCTPSLATLEIVLLKDCQNSPATELADFLGRSNCSLTRLSIGCARFELDALESLLYSQPFLRVLVARIDPYAVYDKILHLLESATGSFLPRLEYLELRSFDCGYPDRFYRKTLEGWMPLASGTSISLPP